MVTATNETVAVPLDGATEARVQIGFGGGELTIGAAPPGMLASGTCDGGVIVRRPAAGVVRLEPDLSTAFRKWRPMFWELGVTSEVPVDLELETGGNRSAVDVSALHVRRLSLSTGASETRLRLPAAGRPSVHVSCGFAAVTIEVPSTMAAHIRGRMALGSTDVDVTRFRKTADGWMSPGFEDATDRAEIEVEGGFGSVRVM